MINTLSELYNSEFRKIPGWGSQIFRCDICLNERIYGCCATVPDNTHPFILCEGSCQKHTRHTFVKVHLGRTER